MSIIFARKFRVKCNLCKLDVMWEILDAHQTHVLQYSPPRVCSCGGTLSVDDLGDVNDEIVTKKMYQ